MTAGTLQHFLSALDPALGLEWLLSGGCYARPTTEKERRREVRTLVWRFQEQYDKPPPHCRKLVVHLLERSEAQISSTVNGIAARTQGPLPKSILEVAYIYDRL